MKNIQKQQFVKIAGIFLFAVSAPLLAQQTYKDKQEYKGKEITYQCERLESEMPGKTREEYLGITYTFTNKENKWNRPEPDQRNVRIPSPINSRRIMYEILYEAYGGKENMQALKDEMMSIRFYVNYADLKVKEIEITIWGENPHTTPLQMEFIEKQVKEKITFIVDKNKYWYKLGNFTYLVEYDTTYTISEIPKLLEEMKQ